VSRNVSKQTFSIKIKNFYSTSQKDNIKPRVFSRTPARMGMIALALLPLSACGDGGGSPTNSAPPPPPAPPTPDFTEDPANTFTARDDNDRILDQKSATADLTVTGKGGDDSITTGSANDVINGGAGHDTIIAGSGIDTIDGAIYHSYASGAGTLLIDVDITQDIS